MVVVGIVVRCGQHRRDQIGPDMYRLVWWGLEEKMGGGLMVGG